jgi:hypothetical protein
MRSLKPEFWHDQEITRLPRDARLLYMAMWNLADEHGRLQGDPRFIKGQAFPYDDDLSATEIDALVDALRVAGKAVKYQVRGATYLYLPKLAKHQRLDSEKVPSRLPAPEDAESEPEPEPFSDESAKNTDLGVNESALSMLHVAGGMEHVSAPQAAPETESIPKTKRTELFGEFWSIYPRRTSKRGAESEFERALKRAQPDTILAGARRYRDDPNRTDEFTKHPSTWLHNDCWTDDPLPRRLSAAPTTQSRPDGWEFGMN